MDKKRKLLKFSGAASFFLTILLLSPFAFAGGGGHVPFGFYSEPMTGYSLSPGIYFTEWLLYYTSGKLKDNHGTLSLTRDGMKLDGASVYLSANRILWISKFKILGFNYGAQFVVPVERANLMTDALTPFGPAHLSEGYGGVGDLYFNPIILTWHDKNRMLHITGGVDITAPTGPYHKGHETSIGKNVWTFTPGVKMTVFLPWHPQITLGLRLEYNFNTRNDDYMINSLAASKLGSMALTGLKTDFTPGQEFHLEYALAYRLTPSDFAPSVRVGLVGIYYQQITDDKTGIGAIKIDKGRTFSLGPGAWVKYKKCYIGVWDHIEMGGKNRTQGNLFLSMVNYSF